MQSLPRLSGEDILSPFIMKMRIMLLVSAALLAGTFLNTFASSAPNAPAPQGCVALAEYFRAETAKLADRCLTDVTSLEDWQSRHGQYRHELFEMMGLWPLPPRTDLKPVITGRLDHDQFTMEKLHFQSRPGLYVTANLYLPKGLTQRAPAILYVCGHGPVITNGVSYGNKVSYQHHGAWFARNGYVCLIIDTLQLGEILGLHHGTYREGLWWWNSRGYTPAGIEAWNSIRALDYLCTRPEVDTNRFGITGRSGGGAYSWFTAALDDRVQAVAPVAGITDLQNHVVDGAVEGHCDCMFFVNTYRWDYPLLAALTAPRPLLLVNTDSDSIFPLSGVLRTHAKLRQLYALHRATNAFGLVIGPGPHKDTQDLQVPVLRWFNKHLKGQDSLIETAAVRFFTPQQLKVLDSIPPDAINTNVHDTFVPTAKVPPAPASIEVWHQQCEAWLGALQTKSFAGWPQEAGKVEAVKKFSAERDGVRFEAFDFNSQSNVRLRLYAVQRSGGRESERAVLTVVGEAPVLSRTSSAAEAFGRAESDLGRKRINENRLKACPTFPDWLAMMRSGFEEELSEELGAMRPAPPADREAFAMLQQELSTNAAVLFFLPPRGAGLTAWEGDARKQVHLRRRFMLLGQTLDGMRVWDIRRAVQAARTARDFPRAPLWLRADGELAVDALYASLFEPDLAGLELWRLPASHQTGPDFLNVLRFLDVPQAVAMATERCPLRLHQTEAQAFTYAQAVATALSWDTKRLSAE